MEQVVIGGLIAVVGGVVGAVIQGRREHTRWLRAERLTAYVELVNLFERATWGKRTGQRAEAWREQDPYAVRDTLTRSSLLGPRKVDHALQVATLAVGMYLDGEIDHDDLRPLLDKLDHECRRALGIRPWKLADLPDLASKTIRQERA